MINRKNTVLLESKMKMFQVKMQSVIGFKIQKKNNSVNDGTYIEQTNLAFTWLQNPLIVSPIWSDILKSESLKLK